jgi:protease IV
VGTPLRRMTPAEQEQLQSVIDDLFASFVEVVRRGRPALPAEALTRLADGRIYSARQAKDAGLVDDLGYLPDAVDELERRAGVEEARVVVYHRPREWRENLYSASAPPEPRTLLEGGSRAAAALGGPAFLYLWWPGL